MRRVSGIIPPWTRPRFEPTSARADVLLVALADRDVLDGNSLTIGPGVPRSAPVADLKLQSHHYHNSPDRIDAYRTGALRNIAQKSLSDPARLDAVTHLYDIRIEIDDPADLTHLQLAWAVAAGLVRAGCHTILDAHAITWLDGYRVAALPADRPFALGDEIGIVAETDPTPGFGHAVHTRGMHKFARPDLITGVPADRIEYTGKVLNHLAGLLAEGAVLRPGQILRFDGDITIELEAYRPDGNGPEVHLNNEGMLINRLR